MSKRELTGLREPLLGLDGKPVEEIYDYATTEDGPKPLTRPVTFISLIANRVYTAQRQTDAMLLRSIGRRLYEGPDTQVFEEAEIDLMRSILDADESFYAFSRAHCEEILDKATVPTKKLRVLADPDPDAVVE